MPHMKGSWSAMDDEDIDRIALVVDPSLPATEQRRLLRKLPFDKSLPWEAHRRLLREYMHSKSSADEWVAGLSAVLGVFSAVTLVILHFVTGLTWWWMLIVVIAAGTYLTTLVLGGRGLNTNDRNRFI